MIHTRASVECNAKSQRGEAYIHIWHLRHSSWGISGEVFLQRELIRGVSSGTKRVIYEKTGYTQDPELISRRNRDDSVYLDTPKT